MTAAERRSLQSIRHNVDEMQLIMNSVRAYLDATGFSHVPLNITAVDRLALNCHQLIDQVSGHEIPANPASN